MGQPAVVSESRWAGVRRATITAVLLVLAAFVIEMAGVDLVPDLLLLGAVAGWLLYLATTTVAWAVSRARR